MAPIRWQPVNACVGCARCARSATPSAWAQRTYQKPCQASPSATSGCEAGLAMRSQHGYHPVAACRCVRRVCSLCTLGDAISLGSKDVPEALPGIMMVLLKGTCASCLRSSLRQERAGGELWGGALRFVWMPAGLRGDTAAAGSSADVHNATVTLQFCVFVLCVCLLSRLAAW